MANDYVAPELQGTNPKDTLAIQEDRAPLDYLEPAGDEATARVLKFGADKYGRRNYVKVPILYRVYIGAAKRHLAALQRGEDLAPDSLIHHAGHVAANMQIILAAIEAGTLVDDRGPFPETQSPAPHDAFADGLEQPGMNAPEATVDGRTAAEEASDPLDQAGELEGPGLPMNPAPPFWQRPGSGWTDRLYHTDDSNAGQKGI